MRIATNINTKRVVFPDVTILIAKQTSYFIWGGVLLKRRNSFIYKSLCLIICFALVTSVFYGGDYISGKVIGVVSYLFSLKSDFQSADLSIKNAFNDDSSETFSPSGFGGGGYNVVTYKNGTPSDIVGLMEEAKGIYKNLKKTGDIKEQQFCTSATGTSYGAVSVNNRTDENISIKNLLNETPKYKTITKDEPYVLVYHTHTTEGYELLDLGWYSNQYDSRTKDARKNMVRVGEELVKELEKAGYKVIHDKTIYDSSYNGAYGRSLVSVEKYLKKYPSIVLTLDVHRDAIHYDNGAKSKPTAEINGKKAAQVMIISGCEGDGVEDFPKWKDNLTFALHLQNTVEEKYDGLMRPIFFCNRKYNMNVTPCSLLLEFGTDANTLEEAVYSASLIGKSISEMLDKELKK